MSGRRDATIFDAHIEANESDLLRFFQRRLLNNADAAEAFGELLLTAWRHRGRIPADPTHARMWLYTAARNVLRDTRRSLARRSAAVERFQLHARTHPEPVWDDTALDVRDAIERLSPDDAELVRLIYWDGLASHEAAVVLGINPSTARSRLSRARRELRERLTPDDDQGLVDRAPVSAARE